MDLAGEIRQEAPRPGEYHVTGRFARVLLMLLEKLFVLPGESPMNAAHPPHEFIAVAIVGIVFGTIALVMTSGILCAALTGYCRSQSRRMGSELIHEMLQRKFQADEIERILALWADDRRLARRVLRQGSAQVPLAKGAKLAAGGS